MSDLHYDSTEVRKVVMDSVIQRVNEMKPSQNDGEINSVIVLGDITQDGTEYQWNNFVSSFGLNGEAGLKYPVYEFAGNHDGNIDGVVRNSIRKRNTERNNISGISENGLHYSWDIGNFHFVALGIYPGLEWDPDCEWCHYFKESFRDPEMSLAFLKKDLKENLKDKKQPVILCFHYGWDDFSLLWWTEDEQESFYQEIKDYNVKGIFHGHNHSVDHYYWKGIDVWSAGSPQSGEKTGNFMLVKLTADSLQVKKVTLNSIELLN
ncbi:MAG: metallophosphoesterase [Bacteroidales bacterium]|nr:metallophosphoesterase [Bacteroidales bacterium]